MDLWPAPTVAAEYLPQQPQVPLTIRTNRTNHMKTSEFRLGMTAGIVGLAAFLTSVQAATNALPTEAALPLGSSTTRGFTVRSVQAPSDAVVPNNLIRAIKQLNGTLTDAGGNPIPDEAYPGPNPDGSYDVDTVNFELYGDAVTILTLDSTELVTFPSQPFPGLPGAGGHDNNSAVEVVGYLELTPGVHTFGVSVCVERTDANDDDGYAVFVGTNPRDRFALKVGEFERNAPGFPTHWRNENQWSVEAPVAGLYPFRIVYWQTGLGANLNFYSVNPDTGERILVNDPTNPQAVKAYKDTSVAAAKGPYVAEINPQPGSDGNSASAPIEALIVDGTATVGTANVKLFLNGNQVTPQSLSKTGNKLFVRYNPNASRPDKSNSVRLEFKDSAGTTHVATWSFGIIVAGGSSTVVTGQWDFDKGDLSPTVGKSLEYLDGPNGLTKQKTRFGTTTELGVPDIAGQPAKVMEVPGDLSNKIGYIMDHGIAPNGGGTKVNQYTLIMDVLVANTGPGAASLLQISSTNNTDDGDLFWQGNNFGQGAGGYNGRGTFTAGEWHRVVAAYDMAANPPVVTKFVDGIKQDDWTANQGLDNPRRALQPTAILFGDGDQDERRQMWVNSIQIRSGKITDAEAVLLGGPSANGIPRVIPQSTVTGQWDFEFGDLGATIGKPLQYLDGIGGMTEAGTQFGTTTELGIPDINGQPARVMRVPGDLSNQIGYIMDHGIAPNGGGTKVNQYTLIMDILVANTGPGAASLLQISSTNNTDDGDLFWQGNNFGQGGGGYNGLGTFTAGEWHRMIAAYDMAANPPVVTKFVDGIKQDDWTANQGLDNPRRALQPTAILFGDGDQDERREMWVNSIQIRAGKLTDEEMLALGGPSADGIPVYIPVSQPPTITCTVAGKSLTLSWPSVATGFVLESTPGLTNPNWTEVPGVVNNAVTVQMTGSAQFFRLRK